MFEIAASVSFTALLGFVAWTVNAIYIRPTREEVDRIEDKVIKRMEQMEKRLMEAIRK